MARVTLANLQGKKYVAISPMSVMPNDIYLSLESPLILNRNNGSMVTIPPVFSTADSIDELRRDLHAQVDALMDVAAQVLG